MPCPGYRFTVRAVGIATVVVMAIATLVPVLGGGRNVPPHEQVPHATATTPPPVEAATKPATAESLPASPAAVSVINVCGVGPTEIANRADPWPAREDAMPDALRTALGEMEGGGSPSGRAVGLYFEAVSAARAARRAAYAGSSGCGDSDTCADNVDEIAALAAQPYLQQLVSIAAQDNDPAPVALALSLCKEQTGAPACDERITAARWARLEPDNAAAWLNVAAEAEARADAPAAAEAVERAGAAFRFEDYGRALLTPIDTSAVKAAAPVDRFQAQSSIAAVWMNWPDVAYQQMTKACLVDALDDRRRNACSSLAQLIADESMMGRTLSIAIAQRAGWSAERVDALRAEQVRFQRALKSEAPADQADRLTCSGLDSMQRLLTVRARGSELRDLRQRLADTN